MKITSIGQNLAVINRKIFIFLGTKFCCLKMTSQISKIDKTQFCLSRRFKICNMILSSLLGNGRINMYFSKFKPYDKRGRSQFKISHIPWLEHITMEHLWEKSRKIHCKTKINDPSESQRKKGNIKRFFDIFGLVREVKQFKNKLKRWLKTALLFFFVSYPNFFKRWHPYSFSHVKLQIFVLTEWVGFQISVWKFFVAIEFFSRKH